MTPRASAEQIDALNAEAMQIRDDEELSDFQAISAVARRRNLTLVREDDQTRLYRLPTGELVNCWIESPHGTTFETGLGFDDQTELHD